ncbi:hypothetical protein E2I00_006599, partial [Balaenoptera physalus]
AVRPLILRGAGNKSPPDSQGGPLPESCAHARVGQPPGAGQRGHRSSRHGAVARVSLMMTHVRGGGEGKMAAPMEVAVCTDSAAQLWSCVVWELHSGANLLTYRGGQAGPRGLALLNGEHETQKLLLCLGPASAEDHVPRTGHLSHHVAQWPLRSGRDRREHIPVGGRETEAGRPVVEILPLLAAKLVQGVWADVSGPSAISRRLRNQVTCLSVSTDGSVLLSGSHDETVRLWDVQSQQCLRTVALKGGRAQPSWRPWARGALPFRPHRGQPGAGARTQGLPRGECGRECTGVSGPGPVTNACIMLAPISMLSSDFRPSLPLPHFNKHLLGTEHGDEPRHGGLTLRLGLHQQ